MLFTTHKALMAEVGENDQGTLPYPTLLCTCMAYVLIDYGQDYGYLSIYHEINPYPWVHAPERRQHDKHPRGVY